jgi:hypothetical protein
VSIGAVIILIVAPRAILAAAAGRSERVSFGDSPAQTGVSYAVSGQSLERLIEPHGQVSMVCPNLDPTCS